MRRAPARFSRTASAAYTSARLLTTSKLLGVPAAAQHMLCSPQRTTQPARHWKSPVPARRHSAAACLSVRPIARSRPQQLTMASSSNLHLLPGLRSALGRPSLAASAPSKCGRPGAHRPAGGRGERVRPRSKAVDAPQGGLVWRAHRGWREGPEALCSRLSAGAAGGHHPRRCEPRGKAQRYLRYPYGVRGFGW